MHWIVKRIKYNPLSFKLYDAYLRLATDRTKAFIFVATTGRSGSTSLRTILGEQVDNCVSFHEPYPMLGNNTPPGTDRNRYYREQFYRRKLPIIRLACSNYDYYAETNHQFIKHFAEHAIDAFKDRIRIVHLVREPVKVAVSFFSLNSIPGVSGRGKKYLLDPEEKGNLIQINDLLAQERFSHEFFRCIWYWYEVEARVKKLKEQFREVNWHQMQTSDLANPEALSRMFSKFGLPLAKGEQARRPVRENTKFDKKTRSISPEAAEGMHAELLQKMEERYGARFWN